MRPDKSLEFEYRRLAAVCLGLAKRAASVADKTRLLLIAEAWLDLADRVGRNRRKAERASVDLTEHRMVGETLPTSEPAPASAAPGRHSRRERFDTGMQYCAGRDNWRACRRRFMSVAMPPRFLSHAELDTVIRHAPLVAIDLIIRNARDEVLLGLRKNEPAKGCYFVPGGTILKSERLAETFAGS
jgi:hypothetical protein